MEYRKSIVGRKHEQEILQMCVDSPKAEFIAVYGRRRIGKTYLVKQFFGEKFDFYTTGIYNVSRAEQLKRWQEQLYRYSGTKRTRPKDWFEAFMQLQEFVELLKFGNQMILNTLQMPLAGMINHVVLEQMELHGEQKKLVAISQMVQLMILMQ